jgi:hypothetical protein
MAQLQPTNLHLVNGEDVLDIKAFDSDAGASTIASNAALAVIGAQSMAFVANGGVLQLGSNVGIRVINNGVQNYNLPTQTPQAGQIMVAQAGAPAGSAVDLAFQTVSIPSAPAGSTFQYNPSNANLNMGNYSISNASDLSSGSYSLNTVGAESAQNASDISAVQGDVSTLQSDVSTLQGQVSTLQSDVSTLQGQLSSVITILFNLTGIQV